MYSQATASDAARPSELCSVLCPHVENVVPSRCQTSPLAGASREPRVGYIRIGIASWWQNLLYGVTFRRHDGRA